MLEAATGDAWPHDDPPDWWGAMQRAKYAGEGFLTMYGLKLTVFVERWLSIAMAAESEAREVIEKNRSGDGDDDD